MNTQQKEHITELRRNGGGYKAIAAATGISLNTVKSFCRRNGLMGETGSGATIETSYCPVCGTEIVQQPNRKHKRFCSDECRMKWHDNHRDMKRRSMESCVCAYCRKTFYAYGERKYCSHECYINARFGKGGSECG